MENKIQLFKFEGKEVRTLKIDGEPWFVGKDVATILGYKRLQKAVQDHVDPEDKCEKLLIFHKRPKTGPVPS
ncbi:BRO-N domain-containing protein [Lactobacillus johnsonii]|uniref:BRO-N domain-containing protein n=1 Tax=Lactobacillus johnsonii TaxID=33959 RepID=UPI003D7814E7